MKEILRRLNSLLRDKGRPVSPHGESTTRFSVTTSGPLENKFSRLFLFIGHCLSLCVCVCLCGLAPALSRGLSRERKFIQESAAFLWRADWRAVFYSPCDMLPQIFGASRRLRENHIGTILQE